jgi:hypothetical protein
VIGSEREQLMHTKTTGTDSDRLVAFIDILGFKELVLQEKDDALRTFHFIDERLNHIVGILRSEHEGSFSAKMFSDCMCVSCGYSVENLHYMLYELAFIQLWLSFEGLFLRGALTRGDHFESDTTIFSRGLVQAYELERAAVQPRIIIDAKLVPEIVNDDKSYYAAYTPFTKSDFVMKAPDGRLFVDYLHMLWEEGHEHIDAFRSHRKAILVHVRQHLDDAVVLSKLQWLADYHNAKFSEFFSPDGYDDAYASRTMQECRIDIQSVFPQCERLNPDT